MAARVEGRGMTECSDRDSDFEDLKPKRMSDALFLMKRKIKCGYSDGGVDGRRPSSRGEREDGLQA